MGTSFKKLVDVSVALVIKKRGMGRVCLFCKLVRREFVCVDGMDRASE